MEDASDVGLYRFDSVPETSDAPAKPKPKFKFLKRGEGTHKRVNAPKLIQRKKLQDSFSTKVDLAAASEEQEAGYAGTRSPAPARPTQRRPSENNSLSETRGRTNGSQSSGREGGFPSGSQGRPSSLQRGQTKPKAGGIEKGRRDGDKNKDIMVCFQTYTPAMSRGSVEYRCFTGVVLQDAEVQEFARLERQIRMEVGDILPDAQQHVVQVSVFRISLSLTGHLQLVLQIS